MKYLNVKQITESYPFTLGQIQNWLLHREKNGLDTAVRKIGRRIYVRSDLFEEWIEKHQDKD